MEIEWQQDESDGEKKVGAPVRALAAKSLQGCNAQQSVVFGAQAVACREDIHIIKLKPRTRCKMLCRRFPPHAATSIYVVKKRLVHLDPLNPRSEVSRKINLHAHY